MLDRSFDTALSLAFHLVCTAKVSCDTAKCLVDVMVLGASRVSMRKATARAVGEEVGNVAASGVEKVVATLD